MSSYKPKILLQSHMKLGDTVLMTCAVRDLKKARPEWEIAVETNHMAVWDNNPHLSVLPQGPNMTLRIGTGKACTQSSGSGLHISRAFHKPIEELLDIQIPRGPMRGEIFLSKKEPVPSEPVAPFWLITTGGRVDMETKIWPAENWQAVVDALPWIDFVQIGARQDDNPRLTGPNVENLVGKTENLRYLFNLFRHCSGSLGAVSAQMHLAAVFQKPCVVVAGAREPASFEAYNTHRFIHNIGALPCARNSACWACKLGGCKAKRQKKNLECESDVPLCMEMIEPDDVIRAFLSYYKGGVLKQPEEAKPEPCIPRRPEIEVSDRKTFRMVANAHGWAGGERSSIWLCHEMERRGYRVEFVPTKKMNGKFQGELLKHGHEIKISKDITSPCDILCFYANDAVFDFAKKAYNPFWKVSGKRKIMVLNYRIGAAGGAPWSMGWDAYGFLNTQLRDAFVKAGRGKLENTFVLPPPAELEEFFDIERDYSGPLHFVRHSSQGDVKHRKDINELMEAIRVVRPDAEFSFMPAPTWCADFDYVHKFLENEIPVKEFLSRGNICWYLLPDKYNDNGPRAIMEAMAAGLGVIADNRFGAKDRLTEGGVMLCGNGRIIETICEATHLVSGVGPQELGRLARQKAQTWDPQKWIKEMEG